MIGAKLIETRRMTDEEKKHEGWDFDAHNAIVLVFNNGAIIYPSRDEEGNGPGAIFGRYANGEDFSL